MSFTVDDSSGLSASAGLYKVTMLPQVDSGETGGFKNPFVIVESVLMELRAKRDDAEGAVAFAAKRLKTAEIKLTAAKAALMLAKAKHDSAIFALEEVKADIQSAAESQCLLFEAGIKGIRNQLEEGMPEEDAA